MPRSSRDAEPTAAKKAAAKKAAPARKAAVKQAAVKKAAPAKRSAPASKAAAKKAAPATEAVPAKKAAPAKKAGPASRAAATSPTATPKEPTRAPAPAVPRPSFRGPSRPDVDAVVVGAGLAGLACALTLTAAGRSVAVLEAGDAPGGRVRTDAVDGFRLDRGFQVLLAAYPEARRWFDATTLDLRAFAPGVVVRRGGRAHRLADPFRAPLAALTSALSPIAPPLDALRLLGWRRSLLAGRDADVATRPQVTTAQRLADRRFSAAVVDGFFRPFLAGTFLDPDLATSSRVTELTFRWFFEGPVVVPGAGMQALPDQLAARLPEGALRLGRRVVELDLGDGARPASVRLDDGSVVAGSDVIVATEAPAAVGLVGAAMGTPQALGPLGVPAPGRSSTTVHFRAPFSPTRGRPDLVLGAVGDGPIATLATMSDVAATYAPTGQHVVSVSSVGTPADEAGRVALVAAVRAQARAWFGAEVDGWEELAVNVIPYAQPRQTPRDLASLARSVRAGVRLWVCGDHRDMGSIQGALTSGRRTAEEILDSTGSRPRPRSLGVPA